MAQVAFSLSFDGVQEVPDQTTSAFGTGLVIFDTITNTASYVWQISGIDFGTISGQNPATPTTLDDAVGFHFHNNARDVNGPIVFDIPSQDTDDLQVVNTGGNTWSISGTWEPTDPANNSITTFAAALAAGTVGADVPIYGNIHTATAPGGLIRAQWVGFRQPPQRDFNGDGKSDILWQNDNGAVHTWQMNGAGVAAASDVFIADPGSHLVGTGDFNGDGLSDFLWDNGSNSISIRQTNAGAAPINVGPIGSADATWQVRATGDFNADSTTDILWRNDNGAVHIWQMNGSAVAATGDVGIADASWQIRGTGDFGGDGRADILWQNVNGSVEIWQMSGTTVLSAGPAGFADPSWHIRGTGDFGGDGKADILWQNDNGIVHIWEMNGTTLVNSADAGFADASWHIRDIGDFSDDGKSDIVWQNDNGTVEIWQIDGTTVTGTGQPGAADTTWNILPPDNTSATATPPSPLAINTSFGFGDIAADQAYADDPLPSTPSSGNGSDPSLLWTGAMDQGLLYN